MPFADSGGVRLYYEEAGAGLPIVFVHEFSGDLRSWEPQIQYFSRRYRCIAFNARGYPPSDVPSSVGKYSQKNAVEDLAAILRHLRLPRAHIMGCSMGAQTTLYFGLTYPRMAMTLTTIGLGSGGDPRNRTEYLRTVEANARVFDEHGLPGALKRVQTAPNRVQLKHKNPRSFDAFGKKFLERSAQGCANILRGIQARRPPIYSLERKIRALEVPFHLIVGDEDPGAVDASLFVKRVCPAARLTIAPASGHLVNLEEPDLVHRLTDEFYALVESRRWRASAAAA